MWLPTKAQVGSASRHAITIASTAAVIFGLQAKGVNVQDITATIQALGPFVNDLVTLIGTAGATYAMLKAAHSASPTSQAIAVAEEGLERMPDAVLAHWATQIEEELVAAEKEEC